MCFTLPKLTGSCARGAKPIGAFGLVRGPLTRCYQSTVLAVLHSITLLPIITGRGVKYTHNDINDHTLLTDSRGPGLCVIHPERHQSLEVDTHPTRSAEHTGSLTLLAPATTTSAPAYDCEYSCEASKFGNDSLRMAGIVQMLHRHNSR